MNTMRSIDLNQTSPISPKQRNMNTMRSLYSNQTSPIYPKQRNMNTNEKYRFKPNFSNIS